MAPPLITITRQYASGGSDVARLVADALGWTVIDNEFVDEVAQRAGLPRAEVAQREERAAGLLERLARTLAAATPELSVSEAAVSDAERDEAEIHRMTERIIHEAANEGRAIVVGRGAQAILARRPDALHVYVVASKPWRRRLAIEKLGVDPAAVDKVIEETDKGRDRYVKTYSGRVRRDLDNYDLVVNAERLGIEGAAGVIVAEAKRRGWS